MMYLGTKCTCMAAITNANVDLHLGWVHHLSTNIVNTNQSSAIYAPAPYGHDQQLPVDGTKHL